MALPFIPEWDGLEATPAMQSIYVTIMRMQKVLEEKIIISETVGENGVIFRLGNRYKVCVMYHSVGIGASQFVDLFITDLESRKTIPHLTTYDHAAKFLKTLAPDAKYSPDE